jgi:hypothetical protein
VKYERRITKYEALAAKDNISLQQELAILKT